MPFPFVEVGDTKSRPALIVSAYALGPGADLFIAAMITSSARAAWRGDVVIGDLEMANLPIPSVVRTAKLSTFASSIARPVGQVSTGLMEIVLTELRATLAIAQH